MINLKEILSAENWEKHRLQIIKDLKLEKEPHFIYEEEAFEFAKKYAKINKKTIGAFLHENLPEAYKETGVVCIFNYSVGTLAHELCHAKQYQQGNKWFKKGIFLKAVYYFRYYYYPTEIEAFTYAEMYLKKFEMWEEAEAYYKRKRKLAGQANLLIALILYGLGFLTLAVPWFLLTY